MHGDRERLVLPGEGGVGEDDVERREIGRDIVDEHRVGVLQPHAPAAGHAGPDPGRAGMKQRDQTGLGDHFVERIVGAVVGPERLRVGVELEAADAGLHELSGLALGELALVRVDAAERDQDVRVGTGGLEDLVVAESHPAHAGFVVDREHHGRHVPLSVVVGDFLGRGLHGAGAEVLSGGREHLGRDRILGVAFAPFGVRVDIDRDDLVEVEAHSAHRTPRGCAITGDPIACSQGVQVFAMRTSWLR